MIDVKNFHCPICNFPLNLSDNTLNCHGGHKWNVIDGIPNFVTPDLEKTLEETIKSFEFKWNYNPVDTSEERNRIATVWYYDRFFNGVDDSEGLRKLLQTKERILDVGCGLGNMTTVFAKFAPEAIVYGIDLTNAVYKIPELYKEKYNNLQLVQGNFIKLPINGLFDFISADGVLHHTPNTRYAFMCLANRLAPNGDLLIYIYRKKAPVREFSDDWLRKHTTKMLPEECIEFCKSITELGQQLRKANVTLHFEKDITPLGIKAGNIDLQRWIYWHILKCFWDDGGNKIASYLENFDWYHPLIAYRHDPEEIKEWCKDAKLELIQLRTGDSGISAWCRKL